MKFLYWLTWVLVIVGALNWGLVGAFKGFDLVVSIFGTGALTSTVYVLVGISAIWQIIVAFKKPAVATM